jgi:hypothetical protein
MKDADKGRKGDDTMTRKAFRLILIAVLMFTVSVFLESAGIWRIPAAWAADDEPDNTEVLTRGPIHEAFAQPVTLDREETFRISRTPPAPIDEIPPVEKPEGKHVMWISGYWSWDEDRNDFLWVSGCWRAAPPHCSWVPGYWRQVDGDYEWVAGFWTPANTKEFEYLPPPPETLESEPPDTPPAVDNIWVPGCWVWQPGGFWRSGRYAWRPGFWLPARTNWVWIPAHYAYTPHGCVFVDGYWDRTLERRGIAFLPVYYPPTVYSHVGFRFTPHFAIDVAVLTQNLFCWPGHHHYYFGDYYAVEYGRHGIYPWFEVRQHHDWYDPIYMHQQWRHRDNPRWRDDLRKEYDHRRDDREARPARTYKDMETQIKRMPDKERRESQVARPLKEIVEERTRQEKFEKLNPQRHEEVVGRGKKLGEYKQQRANWEAPSKTTGTVVEHKKAGPPDESTKKPPTDSRVAKPVEVKTPEPGVVVKEPTQKPAKEPRITKPVKEKTPQSTPVDKKAAEGQDKEIKSHKVKAPARSPIVNEEKPRDKEATPPPAPKTPRIDAKAKPKPAKNPPAVEQREKK